MERICKRTIAFFLLLMLGMLVAVLSVFTVASGTTLAQTADQQRSYRLEVAQTRGTIYDCKMRSFTGQQTEYAAAIVPTIEDAAALSRILTQQEMADVYPSLTAGKPFALRVKDSFTAEGADVFPVEKRYTDEQSAVHVIGYLDGAGVGVSGIEKLFDQQLSQGQGEISVTYQVDATNRVLAGEEKTINDTSFLSRRGVVLTLDQEIQTIAEQAAKKHLKKGAVVVTEIPTCKIRAIVSLPDFNPNDVASVLEDEDAPLLNRALSAYSVGSVFKLVSAASALEYGIPPETRYTCTGGIQVSDGIFHCYNGESHGEEDMSRAIAQSCNTYFVHVMQQVPQAQFLLMAQNLGFGSSVEIAPGFSSAAGDLPTLDSLNIPKALANFSFGQGDLTATPGADCGHGQCDRQRRGIHRPDDLRRVCQRKPAISGPGQDTGDPARDDGTHGVPAAVVYGRIGQRRDQRKICTCLRRCGCKDGHCADGKIRGRRGKGHLLGGGVLSSGGAALCHHRNGRGWNGRRGHLWPGV